MQIACHQKSERVLRYNDEGSNSEPSMKLLSRAELKTPEFVIPRHGHFTTAGEKVRPSETK